jgi:hypothetical protein
MCSPEVRKEANRLNWIIKGKLIDVSWSDTEVEKTYHSYFKRLWGNNEIYIHEDGFEEAYEYRAQELLLEEMKNVARLGYD